MALHVLQSIQKYRDCQSVLAADDALLLLDSALYLSDAQLEAIPCRTMALREELAMAAVNESSLLEGIDYTQWLELVEQHPQQVCWY